MQKAKNNADRPHSKSIGVNMFVLLFESETGFAGADKEEAQR